MMAIICSYICGVFYGIIGCLIFPKGIGSWKWWLWVVCGVVLLNVIVRFVL